jgi:polyisoprenoid-binding protein YceI
MLRKLLVTSAVGFTAAAFAGLAAAQPPMGGPNKDPAAAPAGLYKEDPGHTSVIAKITHMGLSHFAMRFSKVQGTYVYDPAHPEATKVSITIDPASVLTGVPVLDTELAGDKFMNTAKYPTITFVSTGIHRTGPDQGMMDGNLTMMGVTKPVTLNVVYNGEANAMGATKMGFSATTTIRRSDFGFGTMIPMLGDEVQIQIETEFAKAG